MKYVRRIIGLILTVIFLAALIVCTGVVFTIKNVNVTLKDYSGNFTQEIAAVQDELASIKGLYIFAVNSNDVREAVENANLESYITLDSVEKVYPCSLNVALKERIERFAVYSDNAYLIYDADGDYIKTNNENKNNLDGAPNVLVNGAQTDEEIKTVAEICEYFNNKFGNVRNIVESINYPVNADTEFPMAEINLRCGLVVQIVKPQSYLKEKITAAYDCFLRLSDAEKISGTIKSYEISGVAVDIRAFYTA